MYIYIYISEVSGILMYVLKEYTSMLTDHRLCGSWNNLSVRVYNSVRVWVGHQNLGKSPSKVPCPCLVRPVVMYWMYQDSSIVCKPGIGENIHSMHGIKVYIICIYIYIYIYIHHHH